MKKLILFIFLFVPVLAQAYDAKIDGIYYTFNGNEATVTSGNSNYSGSVTLPSSVTYNGNTYSVTSIGMNAFWNCLDLTSVYIPNSVTKIGTGAFEGCSHLTSVTIPSSVISIGGGTFSGCSKLNSVTIPNSVTSIGRGAFQKSGLTSVTIPNSIANINEEVFAYCLNLTSVTIPNSVKSIDYGAFRGCSDLTSISIPNSVTSIGDYAFENCCGLTSVSIPAFVISIGKYAFNGCFGLTSVSIPNSVTSIGNYAFMNCSGLSAVTIPNSVTNIGTSAFADCSSLAFISIPNSATRIADNAFYGCYIKKDSFVNKSSHKTESFTNLTFVDVEQKDGLLIKDNKVVACRRSATSVIIPNYVTRINYKAFKDCDCLMAVAIPNSITYIDEYAFYGCSKLTAATIPNSVTCIGDRAFEGCSNLASIEIPHSVTSIGYYAFASCNGLTSIIAETGNVNYDSRGNCNAIINSSTNTLLFGCRNTVIPNTVVNIGICAFINCSNLTTITIPSSVSSISYGAFYNCSGLTSVYCYAKDVPNIDKWSFYGINSDAVLYVPEESIEAYKVAEVWKDFGTILPIVADTDISTLDNAIYVDETEGHVGESIVLSVKMKNSVEVSGLQCNVYLPEEMEVTKVARGQRLKARDDDDEYIFSFDNSVYEDGSRFILAYTSKDAVVQGNDGEIATITLNIPETMQPGDYPIIIKNTELSKDGNSTVVEYVQSTLKVVDYKQGDANGDGKLSVSDLTSIASHLLGRAPGNFILKAADANNDGKISVSDITAIAKMLLNGSNNARVRTLFTEEVE